MLLQFDSYSSWLLVNLRREPKEKNTLLLLFKGTEERERGERYEIINSTNKKLSSVSVYFST